MLSSLLSLPQYLMHAMFDGAVHVSTSAGWTAAIRMHSVYSQETRRRGTRLSRGAGGGERPERTRHPRPRTGAGGAPARMNRMSLNY